MRVQRAIVCAHQHAQTRPSERRWLGFAFADGNARASECVHIYLCCTQISCSARSRKDGWLSSPRDWLTEPTPTRPPQDKQTSDLIANAVMSAPYLQSQQQPELDKRRNSQLTHTSQTCWMTGRRSLQGLLIKDSHFLSANVQRKNRGFLAHIASRLSCPQMPSICLRLPVTFGFSRLSVTNLQP